MRRTEWVLLLAATVGCAETEPMAPKSSPAAGGETSPPPSPAAAGPPLARENTWSDGLDLDEALALALSRNLRLRANRLETDFAEAQRLTAGTYPYNPELRFDGQRATPFSRANDSTLKLGIGQTFEIAGQRGYRIAIADENIERARSFAGDSARLLRFQVTSAFYEVLADQRRRDIANASA